jgi:hypothetical protein
MRSIMPPLAILPGCAIILMTSIFPDSSFALPVYIGIGLYSILMTVYVYRKAAPEVKRQILIAASGAVLTAVGVGVFFCLR